MTVSTGRGPPERTINEAVANRERNASQEIMKVELQTSTTSSTRQPSSPMLSDAKSSDEDSGTGTRAERCAQERRAPKHPRSVSLADCLGTLAHPRAAAEPDQPAARCEGAGTTAGWEREHHVRQEADMASEDAVFTVMIRQIPRHYTQLKFLAELSCRGFYGLVDFMYFPFDVKKGTNVGYGFINFTDPRHTELFRQEFDNVYLDMEMRNKEKPLRMHPASVQGFQDNYSHFMQTKTGQKADRRYSPLFMPHGSWAGLADDIQMELAQLREAFTSRPPGRLEVAQGDAPGLMLSLSQHIAGTESPAPGEALRTGPLSASALESHDVAQRDLGAAAQAWCRDPHHAWVDITEEGRRGGRAEQTPSPPAPGWGSHPAKIGPSGQLLPPPGLQPAVARPFPRCWPPAPQEPPPPPALLGARAPQHPQPPEGRFWPAAEPDPLWSHRSASGRVQPAEPPVPAARGDDLMETYQQLEEQRQKLLNELVAVQEEQRRAIVSAAHARPPLPSAAFQFDMAQLLHR